MNEQRGEAPRNKAFRFRRAGPLRLEHGALVIPVLTSGGIPADVYLKAVAKEGDFGANLIDLINEMMAWWQQAITEAKLAEAQYESSRSPKV